MNFDFEQSPQEKIISLSKIEAERLGHINVNNSEDIKFLDEKGISLDSGNIIVETEDGKKKTITTKKEDFGTVLMSEDEPVIPSGY